LYKDWRRLPVGNFVAFQSEIIRNLYNILTYSTREMASSNPYIRQMGARRFLGFGSVMYMDLIKEYKEYHKISQELMKNLLKDIKGSFLLGMLKTIQSYQLVKYLII
jgi:hypothetical protein